MSADPFAGANMAAFGSQMARAWQDSLESWWRTLLGDPGRLSELAARLGAAGPGGAADAEQMSRVLDALELLERRMAEIEGQVQSLAENLALVVDHLQAAGRDRPAGDGGR